MTIEQFLEKLNKQPEQIRFKEDTIAVIEDNYVYTPSFFSNGGGESKVINEAGTNEGSCKLFAFARLQDLSEQQTLVCFGEYYRNDVLQNSEGSDHPNIRQFMQHGWLGIQFENNVLSVR